MRSSLLLFRFLNRHSSNKPTSPYSNMSTSSGLPSSTIQPATIDSAVNYPPKAKGHDLYHTILKSPKFIVAPMVDASELAWRILSRYYGAQLCYTPMIHSALFADPKNAKYRLEQFNLESNEEGSPDLDRPLIAQFCSNDPTTFLEASKLITGSAESPSNKIDAIDLNLGCPQGIARKGKYGAFLMDHLDLIEKMVSHMHQNSSIPITAKYRCFENPDETADYTKRLIRSGAQILTIHGRTREQKGQYTGLADWNQIKSVASICDQEKIPIVGNGNILIAKDTLDLMTQTNVNGVMSAEGNLYNPAIFAPLNPEGMTTYREGLPQKFKDALKLIDDEYEDPNGVLGSSESLEHFPNCTKVAHQYLAICATLETRTALSAIKGHLYKLFRAVFDTGRYNDIREKLAVISWTSIKSTGSTGSSQTSSKARDKKTYREVLARFQEVTDAIRDRLQVDRDSGLLNEKILDNSFQTQPHEKSDEYLRRLNIPYSRCQPYIRPLQVTTVPSKQNLAPIDLVNSSTTPISMATSMKDAECLTGDGPEVFYGPVQCTNHPECTNSGAAKCRWGLCKTCCAKKTEVGSNTDEIAEKGNQEECEVHAARVKLELERKAFKAEKRKKKTLMMQRNVKLRPETKCPTDAIINESIQ